MRGKDNWERRIWKDTTNYNANFDFLSRGIWVSIDYLGLKIRYIGFSLRNGYLVTNLCWGRGGGLANHRVCLLPQYHKGRVTLRLGVGEAQG